MKRALMCSVGAAVLLMGCAAPGGVERVILLPDASGKVGGVVVSAENKETRLDSAYAGVEITRRKTEGKTYSEQDIRQRYREVLDALPLAARSYLLHFQKNSTQLTPQSLSAIEKIKANLAEMQAPEIVIIGHTDRVGSVAYNDKLSLERAAQMQKILVSSGIPAERIEVAGRGEREPLVATADEVDEARNRRVEIKVR